MADRWVNQGAPQIWGGNRLAGNQWRLWLKLSTSYWRDTLQVPSLAVR